MIYLLASLLSFSAFAETNVLQGKWTLPASKCSSPDLLFDDYQVKKKIQADGASLLFTFNKVAYRGTGKEIIVDFKVPHGMEGLPSVSEISFKIIDKNHVQIEGSTPPLVYSRCL